MQTFDFILSQHIVFVFHPHKAVNAGLARTVE